MVNLCVPKRQELCLELWGGNGSVARLEMMACHLGGVVRPSTVRVCDHRLYHLSGWFQCHNDLHVLITASTNCWILVFSLSLIKCHASLAIYTNPLRTLNEKSPPAPHPINILNRVCMHFHGMPSLIFHQATDAFNAIYYPLWGQTKT